ncbi:hypothetical protein B7435_20110 [Mycolicibacterium peregrinum]|uniref:GNAT family N-acetyltransferase n=1 Tax=Mycolicibacterium peregrinum TaxID=43304 RepID=A0A2D0A8Q9_MYCPR|nr:hypothetical protein [Mycolicibacterium peregrinum]OWM00008.1 hypothetical protein B7435_20110 [Mycolicibacterium peregrinum]TGB43396.1 hypothetical protein EJD94_10590 [Mycolicibacterium peregrinum]TGB44287.1 hypothetical protein EJD98_10130 [Mycolicibacterium peregrinum]
MTAPQLDAVARRSVTLDESPTWWDPDSECTIVVARPLAERELWDEYVRGACSNYRKHSVEQALDLKALRTGDDTALFCVGINSSGKVVGGLRAKGPYRSVDESHAIVEWSGQPALDAVRKMIADRLPFGVVEMKTAWVCDDPEQSRALTDTLARMPLHAMTLLDIQFGMATAAAYVLKRWLSSGGVLAAKIPATPYPDERYQTKMMWWDSTTFANHADPGQLSRYFAEAQRIGAYPRNGGIDAVTAAGTRR